jgi:hypothetical protein
MPPHLHESSIPPSQRERLLDGRGDDRRVPRPYPGEDHSEWSIKFYKSALRETSHLCPWPAQSRPRRAERLDFHVHACFDLFNAPRGKNRLCPPDGVQAGVIGMMADAGHLSSFLSGPRK